MDERKMGSSCRWQEAADAVFALSEEEAPHGMGTFFPKNSVIGEKK